LEEVVLTAAISRGPRAFVTAEAFLSALPRHEAHLEHRHRENDPFIYFEEEFGTVPRWASRLAQCSPQMFESYAVLRAALLTDGATSRATKELLTMCLNALDNTPAGIRSHAASALRCGARYEAVLGALLLTVPIGGIVAWINGVQALSDLLDVENGGAGAARVDPAV
jgi:alkylhydroperoxidase/carboxymuconolactone decarboxylase family protein YurZ